MLLVRFPTLALIVLGGVIVTACATSGRSYTESRMQETLDIEILPNTSKMFVYRLRLPDDKVPSNVHIARHSGDRNDVQRGGVDVNNSTLQRLHENAAYVVQHMGYCREGFLEIDSSASRYNLWLKGECREGSTDDDIKKFGTKNTLPVKFTN